MKKGYFIFAAKIAMLLLSIPVGILIADHAYISELYQAEIVLSEDIVINNMVDNDQIVLPKGTKGIIRDEVNSNLGDDAGEEFIHVSFSPDEGGHYDAVIATEAGLDKPGSTVIMPDQIESSGSIIAEYRQTRTHFRDRVKITMIIGGVLGLLVSAIVVIALGKIGRRLHPIEEDTSHEGA